MSVVLIIMKNMSKTMTVVTVSDYGTSEAFRAAAGEMLWLSTHRTEAAAVKAASENFRASGTIIAYHTDGGGSYAVMGRDYTAEEWSVYCAAQRTALEGSRHMFKAAREKFVKAEIAKALAALR